MPECNDPMGKAITEFWKTGQPDFIQVFSDIAEPDMMPVEYLFRDYDSMPALEKTALKHAEGKILEVGAAAGSHSLWLQENGKNVTALDISSLSVTVMKQRGIQNVVQSDFFHYHPQEKYDTLLFLMNGTGIAGTLKNFPRFLSHCRSLLKKGGKVLLDSSDLAYMFEDGDELPDHYYGEVSYIMEYKGIKSEPFHWLFIDFYTLTKYVNASGGSCRILKEGEHYDYLAEISWE